MTEKKFTLSRRSLLKSMGALGASAALVACSKDDNVEGYYGGGLSQDEISLPKEETLKVVTGGAARACGSLCVLKAHVKNGVIKRFTTDDIPDEYVGKDNPFGRLQSRACLKCRSWTYMLYNSNRLLYPLMQTRERGDMSGFKTVSWDTAMKRIKGTFDHVRKTYGPGAVLKEQGGGTGGYAGFFLGFETMLGGAITTRQDFSQGCWEHVANFVRPQRFTDFGVTWAPNSPFDMGSGRSKRTGWVKGITGYNIVANSITDLFNAEQIVLWSANPAETFSTHHSNFYLKRMKESGIKFTVIDQRLSPSASTYADTFLSPVQNTDAALVMAIVHSLLTDNIEDFRKLHNAENDAELKAAIGKYIYGFFDDGNPTTYNSRETIKREEFENDFPLITNDEFAEKYKVPAGGSWSAYIFGSSDELVGRGLNTATSIYPHKIGYCARDYDYEGEPDPLKDKYVPAYGNVEKTPEWAEKITGVPAASIRAFAKELVTKKTSIFIGFGLQRQHEGEQATWSILLLSTLILSFGAKGQSIGIPRGPGYVDQNDRFNYAKWLPPAYIHAGLIPALASDLAPFKNDLPGGYLNDFAIDYPGLGFCDTGKISFPALTDTYTRDSIPVKEIYDAIGATNQAKVRTKVITKNPGGAWYESTKEVYPSLWNDGQVQRLPKPIKVIITVGSNKITSNGADVNRTVRNLHLTDPASTHPLKYAVELVVCVDSFMTGNGRYADIVLPSAATFEKYIAPNSSQGNEVICIHGGKAVEPQGMAMNDIDMGWQFYKQWAAADSPSDPIYQAYYKECAPDDKMGADEKVVRSLWENPAVQRPFPYDEWKARGVHHAKNYADKDYIIPDNPADFRPINHRTENFIWNQEFRKQPENYPLHTPSGRVEAYCQSMIEDFEARNFYNYDDKITLRTPIKFAGTPEGYENRGRYVYPVPMYIPTLEGSHACDDDTSAQVTDCNNPAEAVTGYTKHPNPLNLEPAFQYVMCNYHPIQRAHTLHNANPIINELFKYNAKGEHAFYDKDGSGINEELNAPLLMTDDVYEPALLNINAKYSDGGAILNGDIIIIESMRGKGLYSAKLTKRIKPFNVSIAQGSAYNPDTFSGARGEIDKGGSTGTHISQRPSRFGRGFTASDIKVKITKA